MENLAITVKGKIILQVVYVVSWRKKFSKLTQVLILRRSKLQSSRFRLSDYKGTSIPVKVCCILRITHGITSMIVPFYVVDNECPSILGLKTSKKLDLIRRIVKVNRCVPDYLQQYTDCFGKICCQKRHIVVDTEATPVINSPRRILAS